MGQLDMEGIEAGRFDPSAKKCYDDDLMALTATMVGLAGSLAAPVSCTYFYLLPQVVKTNREGKRFLETLWKFDENHNNIY